MPPIETGASNLIPRSLGGAANPDPNAVAGELRIATGTLVTAADASNGSLYHLCDLPARCYLHHGTFFDVENSGFAAVRIGTRDDADALVSQLRSAEAIIRPVAQGDVNHGVQLWEMLGLAAAPVGVIGLYVHAIADATGAGTMPFAIHHVYTN